MMTGDKVMAADAEKMGMIYKVFDDEIFEEESKKIVQTLAQMPTKGLAYTKHALNQSFFNPWEEQLSFEDQYQQKAAATAGLCRRNKFIFRKKKTCCLKEVKIVYLP